MAFTQAQLDALDAAIAEGVLEVGHGANKVRYRSLAEMERIRSMMARALSKGKKGAGGPRYAEFHKGLGS